jgi:CheY-like chemotaxis protein
MDTTNTGSTFVKILVVDDSRSSRMMVKNCLKSVVGFEFEIDEADSGDVAYEKCKPGLHDLVLMDIHMPGMDGYAATKLIRAWERTKGRPEMPIIAVTAMDPAQAATKTKDAGCTTFVSKPLKPAVLSDAIRKVTGVQAAPEKAATPAPPPKEAGGMFSKLWGGSGVKKEKEDESVEQEGLKGMRSIFLAEKQREIGVALAAIDSGDIETVTQLAYRLKGEGANYGFSKISDFGGTLAQAIEGRDFKTARNVTQKLMAYLGKAIELGSATA